MKNIILETKRLKIVIPSIDSLGNWCELQSDKDVMKYIGDGKVRNAATTKENLEFTINHYKKHGFSQFDIFLKEDDKFIGKAGLNYLPQDKNNDIEVGYLLHKKYWVKGYATELAEAFIKWGFKNFYFSRIVACCETENTASSNVMKKCKMKYKGKYLYNGKNECDIYQINNITIKTDNFYLRPFHEIDDFKLCYDLWHDKDVIKPMGINPNDPKEDIKKKLLRYKSFMDKYGFTNFSVFKKDNDEFVGSCGFSIFHDPDGDHSPLPKNKNGYEVELGYLFYKKYWGKGYATELTKSCIDFIFNNYSKINRIVAVTYPANIASQKVLEKIGFEFVSDVNSKEYGKEKFFLLTKTSDVKIRKYQESDAGDLAKIYYNTIHQICKSDYNEEQLNAWAPKSSLETEGWIKKWQKLPPFVAIIKDKIVGFAEFENNGHIDCFYVHHQFQNRNIGSKLLEEIEKIAKQKNLSKIYAEVSITAKSFFEKMGFKISKAQKILIRGVKLDNFAMEKQIHQNNKNFGLPAEYQQIPEYFDKHNIFDDTDIKNAAIEKLLKKQDAKNILDMTCGTGSQVFYLANKGYKVTGSDFSPELLNIARRKAKEKNLDIKFIDGDMRFLKVGSFDAVITMFNAIGHLSKEDFAKAIKNIGKNLSKNGIYIFDIFNLNALTEKVVHDLKMDQKFEVNGDKIHQIQHSKLDRKNAILTSYDNYKIKDKAGKIKEINNSFSLQIYTSKELRKTLEENGFKILKFSDIYGKKFIENKSLNIMVVAQKICDHV